MDDEKMTALKPYPSYRKTALPWLGQIPEHWEAKRLKFILASPVTDGPHETPSFISEGFPFLSVDSIQDGELVFENCRFISAEDHNRYKQKVVIRNGDILLGKAASTGKIAQVKVDFEFSIWSPLAVIRLDKTKALPIFVEYVLKSKGLQSEIDLYCNSNTQKNISMQDIPNLYCILPPLSEQQAIVSYLNRQTAKIDALIAKKQLLLDLLAEQRTALISQVVTRGLNSVVEWKNSGISWVGQVPSHWDVKRIKTLSAFVTSGSRWWAQYYSEEGSLFIRIGNISNKTVDIDLDDVQFVTPPKGAEMERTRVRGGDVLISITANIGSVGVVPDNIDEAYVNQHIALTRPSDEKVNPRWLAYVLLSSFGEAQFQSLLYGGTKDGLGLDDVQNLKILLPPLSEQEKLVDYLDDRIKRLTDLATKVETAVERLREYRATLISSVVTGKVDVRGIK